MQRVNSQESTVKHDKISGSAMSDSGRNHQPIEVGISTRIQAWIVSAVLMLVPFHAFLTVWASTVVGHYTLLRLWPEVIVCGLAIWLLATGNIQVVWRGLGSRRLAWLVALYLGLCVLYYIIGIIRGVGLQAASYGFLLSTRYVVWFVIVFAVASRTLWLKKVWQKLVLLPLVAVSLFAIAQTLFLPADFLGHFGYISGSTIAPAQTINQDTATIRAQSFLRGANPLGAYLLVGLSLTFVMTLARRYRTLLMAILLGALFASFSRSAWLGIVVTAIAWLAVTRDLVRGRVKIATSLIAVLAVLIFMLLLIQNNQGAKNAFLHVNDTSTAAQTSNEDRIAALSSGVRDVLHEPLGRGLGTAGPSSVYGAANAPRNSENYFLGVGQELGWLGLGLFVLICYRLAAILYRQKDTYANMLFAILVGLTLINLLSYAWSDVTLAYLWWGLAAVALGAQTATAKSPKTSKATRQP